MPTSPSAIERGRTDLVAWDRERPKNSFTADPNLARVLELRLGKARFAEVRGHLAEVGARAAGEIRALGVEANLDENLPRLERYNGLGERTESVIFHPSYHAVGEQIWKSGVLARYETTGAEVESLAMLYLFAENAEIGHLCPLACTGGLIKLIQAVGSAEQKKRWLPGLLSTKYAERIHASQFLTEVQGGSDVGANAVVARPDPARAGRWQIFGEKWFCSVADAQLFLMTARPEGAADGTRGLGLFVVPRVVDGATNAFSIRRLKRKLGTRAMASGEIDFSGAVAESLGPIERGFKNVVELVLDTSRVYNAICCAGGMQRSYVEASSFARHRRAFGQPIAEYPLVQEAVATLRAEAMAALAATMRVVEVGDRLARGQGDEALQGAHRMAVNANKYWTSVRNTMMARLAMEILGGNGTIESFSIVPQLYRDAMVLESWEGSHNVLVQQVVKDSQRLRLHEPFVAELSDALGRLSLPAMDAPWRERLGRGLEALRGALSAIADGDGDQRFARRVVDQMAVAQALVAMAEELAAFPEDGAKRGAIRFLLERDLRLELPRPAPIPAELLG
jgi:alkylation response protein AidB-like acyl-CoA dehydrogenase